MSNNNGAQNQILQNVNSLRSRYMEIFHQILDNSLNVNCICKTSQETESNSIDAASSSEANQAFNSNLETRMKINNVCINRICDLSCFENMKYVHFTLKNCFLKDSADGEKCRESFSNAWQSYKFLSENPRSCDYYGTTIFHYAACDNNLNLLKCALEKYADGVHCTDTKGMTPLMRAAQKNNRECIEYLLDHTKSDINGSLNSIYTPLWFSVVNGYNQTCLLLLNCNAFPSSMKRAALTNRDLSSGLFNANTLNSSHSTAAFSSALLSPLRASIVYSRYEIMNYLLEFNTDVYELFDCLPQASSDAQLNAIKFFYRQFGQNGAENFKHLVKLNAFIRNANVYRMIYSDLIGYFLHQLKSNMSLMNLFDRHTRANVDRLGELMLAFDANKLNDQRLCACLDAVRECLHKIDEFISANHLEFRISTNSNFSFDVLFNFAERLVKTFLKPKSLIELCRFELREVLFRKVDSSSHLSHPKFDSTHLKIDYINLMLDTLTIPNYLKDYVLHRV